ncbi:SDR family NAD(P)-dependent oxidoreductase [Paenarthrobacter ureafaciens]|uniref:SDR family NAD(P)-dependent oxidoreductase n=1 Tax=Paenarthrobacter TaxID=1742992 RepID=UPI0029F4638D|nr:SDR family NAD(P)-dependent oxidoreductase [Paenarthrobacter sp. PAE-2]
MTTWLITGCSTGLGRALAKAVLEKGHNAVVTARDTATLQDLTTEFPTTALAVGLDVTDATQVCRRSWRRWASRSQRWSRADSARTLPGVP